MAGAWRWIAGNAAGWAAGLPWTSWAGAKGDVANDPGTAVAIAASAGALMGLSIAIATGVALSALVRRHT